MTKYNDMTDFEINKLVAEKLGIPWGEVNLTPSHSQLFRHDTYPIRQFNPCNSWSDMGPIIEREKIGIHVGKVAPNMWFALSRDEWFVENDKNPLRAAAIVYLMLKESE